MCGQTPSFVFCLLMTGTEAVMDTTDGTLNSFHSQPAWCVAGSHKDMRRSKLGGSKWIGRHAARRTDVVWQVHTVRHHYKVGHCNSVNTLCTHYCREVYSECKSAQQLIACKSLGCFNCAQQQQPTLLTKWIFTVLSISKKKHVLCSQQNVY